MEKIISFQNIEVAPYIVEQLLDVRIDQQMNEHGTFYFKALLPEEKKDSYVINNSQGSNVSLSVRYFVSGNCAGCESQSHTGFLLYGSICYFLQLSFGYREKEPELSE